MNLRKPIALVVLLLAPCAEARISAVLSCADLYKRADAVVKGEVISVSDKGPAGPLRDSYVDENASKLGSNEFVAQFRVDRVISGTVPQSQIDISFYGVSRAGINTGDLIQLKPHEYVVLFLRQRNKGYALIDLDNGKIAASKHSVKSDARGKEGIQEEFSALYNESDPELVKAGLRCTGEMGNASTILPDLRRLKDSKDPGIHLTSVAWLARTGDIPAIKEIVSFLGSEDFSRRSSERTPEHNQRLHDAIDALNSMGGLNNPAIAVLLTPLLKHADWGIRYSTLQALRGLKNPQTLPAIAPLLDDDHKEVQYHAIMAMCAIANPPNTMCPSTPLFDRNPAKYVSDWKTWWKENQSKKP